MEKQELKIEDPATVNDICIIPVVRTTRQALLRKNSAYFHAEKEPAALIVLTPGSQKAYHPAGEDISLEILKEQLPGLTEMIRNYYAGKREERADP